MKIALMQPYFFPYIEYFRMIASCDVFVLFDTAQFSRGSWMSRNRVLDANKGWSYINVPVRSVGRRFKINEALIANDGMWYKVFLNKFNLYQNYAKHFRETSAIIKQAMKFSSQSDARLLDLNATALRTICRELGVDTPITVLSDMRLDLPANCSPGVWGLEVCKAIGADTYINASGGCGLYDQELFAANGVNLIFHEHIDFTYDTGPFEFVPDLSVLDAMMWVDRDRLREVVK